jgi:hypothetical protein
MTGLDLESFLLLLRADLTTWMVLVLATIGLAILVWSCWRSRRVLRKCLVLSLAAHLGLVLYGSTIPTVMWTLDPDRRNAEDRSHIRQIRVAPLVDASSSSARPRSSTGPTGSRTERWDLAAASLKLADRSLRVAQPLVDDKASGLLGPEATASPLTAVAKATPEGKGLAPALPPPEPRSEMAGAESDNPQAQPAILPPSLADGDHDASTDTKTAAEKEQASENSIGQSSSSSHTSALTSDRRLRPDRIAVNPPQGAGTPLAATDKPVSIGPPDAGGTPGTGQRSRILPQIEGMARPREAIPLVRATPNSRRVANAGGSGLAALGDRVGGQNPTADIPRIYQPRLEPDRSTRAQRIGASAASELAVERALDWLARHQDHDGRWDGGIARYEDGSPVKGDDSFTVHCPPGETCFGDCAYWEADTALTALALLTYLGAGYTHNDGRYAEVVGKGLDFLIEQQKPDGDLRGRSKVVGMYCHAMATLALCEACALTADDKLRRPAERAVAFLVNARARDGLAWRYAPGAPVGDTSILGWVVMGLKSAKEVGIRIPAESTVRRGTLTWLDKVATGQSKGLARYQPWEPVTPTMTAEAWVCRQFLGVGGPGPSSSEAAQFLLENDSDRGTSNVYYWYYATLALYQHGGEPWSKWNAKIRDRIVGLQSTAGHQTGSWEPDNSLYGAKGGRIYCTTLAALSLEVYYRYLRLYDAPMIPLEAGQAPARRDSNPERSAPATAASRNEN